MYLTIIFFCLWVCYCPDPLIFFSLCICFLPAITLSESICVDATISFSFRASDSCHFDYCTVDNDVGVRSVAVGDAPLFFASENYPNKYSNDEMLDQKWTFTTTTSGLAVQITVLTALLENDGDRCVDGLKFQDGMFSVFLRS